MKHSLTPEVQEYRKKWLTAIKRGKATKEDLGELVDLNKPWDCSKKGHVWLPATTIGGKKAISKVINGYSHAPQVCNYCFKPKESVVFLKGHKSLNALRIAQQSSRTKGRRKRRKRNAL